MRSSTVLIAAATAGSAIAADSFIAFLPGFDTQSLVAKSIGGGSDATTYVLGCPAGADSSNCGLAIPMQYVAGPKTAVFTLEHVFIDEEDGDLSNNQFVDCSLAGTTVAACTVTMDGPILTNTAAIAGDGSTPPTSTFQTMSGTEIAEYFMTVQIVKETASILNYGTNAYGKPTSYGGANEAKETGAANGAEETGMVTSKATLPSQTGAAAQSGMTSVVSKASSAASDAAASATSTGFATQVTGLGAFALAAVAGVLGVAAL